MSHTNHPRTPTLRDAGLRRLAAAAVLATVVAASPGARAEDASQEATNAETSAEAAAANPDEVQPGNDRRRMFSIRGRLFVPYGFFGAPGTVGLEFSVRPWAPLELLVAGDSNGLILGTEAQANLLLLPLFGSKSRFTPYVGGGVQLIHFLQTGDMLLEEFYPDWASAARSLGREAIRFEGTKVLTGKLEVGIDFVARRGFSFQMSGSRIMQLGDSFGRDVDDGVVFRGWQSWGFKTALGYSF